MLDDNEASQQTTLFGGTVTDEDRKVEFVRVSEEVARHDGQFEFAVDGITYNDVKGVITVFNGNGFALSAWMENHPNAKYATTPEGVRLANAIARRFKMQTEDVNDLMSAVNNSDEDLTLVVKNTEKGRLWVVV